MMLSSAPLFFLLSAKLRTSIVQAYTDDAIFRQTFEGPNVDDNWDFDSLIQVQNYASGGLDFGHFLKVSYPPNERGSPRITEQFDLDEEVTSATLSFDLKLHSQFEFVKGGKMHGLGGGSTTTGCNPIDSKGWSVRLKWREEGVPEVYVYHQDRVANCGDQFMAQNFKFARGQWYRVDLQVQMNSDPKSYDGKAVLYVDGDKLVEVNDLRLSGSSKVDIDKFLFSTFYGGGNSDWSPSKTTYVYYDNFTVNQGLRVTGEQGTECELFLNGIFDPSMAVCCAESCGSCGGYGCSSLRGGSSKCCTGLISRTCDTTSSAPCKFEEEATTTTSTTTTTTTTSTSTTTAATTSENNYQQMQQCHSLLLLANIDLSNTSNNNNILDSTEYITFLNNLARTFHPQEKQWITFEGIHNDDFPDQFRMNFVGLSCLCPAIESTCCAETIGIYIGGGTDHDMICEETLKDMEDLRMEALEGISFLLVP